MEDERSAWILGGGNKGKILSRFLKVLTIFCGFSLIWYSRTFQKDIMKTF